MSDPADNIPQPPSKIGFPEGVLGEAPVRLSVLGSSFGRFAAIDKPADLLFDSYLGAPKLKSVMLALREQLGKGELQRLGVKSPYAVHQIDFEYSGAAVFAADKSSAESMRNAVWSGAWTFEFLFLARAFRKGETEFTVDLPVLMHEERPVWIVSHRFGKKASTSFRLEEHFGDFQLWRATAKTIRPHQIRLHAAEAGLDIVGEWIYSKTPYIFLSKLKGGEYKLGKGAMEKALYPHLAVHLAEIKTDAGDVFRSELPKGFLVLLKKLKNTFTRDIGFNG